MSERLLVTGAQGFLGRHVVAAGLAADPKVRILGIGRSHELADAFTHRARLGSSEAAAPLPSPLRTIAADPRYRYRRVDLLDRPALLAAVEEFRPTIVLHLALSRRDRPLVELLRTNVATTEGLLEAIAGSSLAPPRVLLASSGAVYGALPADGGPLGEDAPRRPADLYGISLQAAEDAARVLARLHRIPLVVARTFNLVGPGEHDGHIASSFARQLVEIELGLRDGELEVGPLETTRDYIDVRDAAVALVAVAARAPAGSVVNVASGREVRGETLLETLLEAAGPAFAHRPRLRRQPARPLDLPRQVANVARLAALSSAPARPLAASLRDLLDWYRTEVREQVAAIQTSPSAGDNGSPVPVGPIRLVADVRREQHCDVEIERGLARRLPRTLADRFPGVRMVVLSDTTVAALYGRELIDGLIEADVSAELVTVPPGERSKSFDSWRETISALHGAGFDRRALLVNLGGGLVCDLGGFVAATYLRGVAYVNVPTTLLAQHDAAIGGKVAVNAPWAKNFVGAFHQPCAAFIDPEFLATLDRRQMAAGLAEAIKVALTGDRALFELLERQAGALLAEPSGDGLDALQEIVVRCARRKLALLAPDPLEADLRRVLNLGHTFGHVLETELEYEGMLHGEAVAFGLAVAAAVARNRGVIGHADAERIFALLLACELPPRVAHERLHAATRRLDAIRLVRGRRLHFVLPEAVDRVSIVPELADDEIPRALDTLAGHPRMGRVVGPAVRVATGGRGARP